MTWQREGLEGTAVIPRLWQIPSRGPQEDGKLRILVDDPQALSLPGEHWLSAKTVLLQPSCEPSQVPPPWAATSLEVQCRGEAKGTWVEVVGGGKATEPHSCLGEGIKEICSLEYGLWR